MKSGNLRLHPWRDGVDHCLRLLEPRLEYQHPEDRPPQPHKPLVVAIRNGQNTHASGNGGLKGASVANADIKSLDVCFHASEEWKKQSLTSASSLGKLWDAIGRLPHLESLIVRYTPTHKVSNLPNIMSVASLTSCLEAPLMYLTLIGIPICEGDDLDWNALKEVLRIHPTLISVVWKDCVFSSKQTHLEELKHVLRQTASKQHPSPSKRHVEFVNPRLVDVSTMRSYEEEQVPWYLRFLCGCCIILFLLAVLLRPIIIETEQERTYCSSPIQRIAISLGLMPPPPPPRRPWWKRILPGKKRR